MLWLIRLLCIASDVNGFYGVEGGREGGRERETPVVLILLISALSRIENGCGLPYYC